MRNRLPFLPLSCLMMFSLAGCSSSTTAPVASDDPFQQAEEKLSPLATQCTFVASSDLMTVAVAAGETAIISRRAADSAILQNGQSCDNLATSSTLKKIVITGAASAAKTLILDFTNGLFGVGTSSTATTGIDVNLGVVAGNTLGIRGTAAADNIAYGASGVNLNNDAFKDITVANVDTHVVYLGDGADTFTAAGGTAIGAAFGAALSVYGGAGADLFNQGALATPSETINGGADTDTVSYALRVATVTVTVGAAADDGLALEVDDIKSDVEIVTGGTGDDTMTAATATAITFNGGLGNDTLIGDSANDTLNGDAGNDTLRGKDGNDTLNGGDGNDTFDEETAANGGDVFNGGAGTDTLDYSARLLGVTVTMDGAVANDGATVATPAEADNCKADVENILGTGVADSITGNALNNAITGGLGADTLSGGAGDDTFLTGAVSDGLDTISGGTGVDTIDYSGRAALVVVVLNGVTGSGLVGEGDLLATDMENVIGTGYNDTITGNAGANELVGGVGDDTLNGLGGDDVLEGGGLLEVNHLDCGTGDGDIGFGEGTGTGASRANCEF